MCPECGEPMIAYEFDGVEIDRCLSCGGTWLDSGEIEQICELGDVDSGPLTEAIEQAKGPTDPRRRCPRCARKMEQVRIGRETPVSLERCPLGDGLWFDRGELRGLVQNFHEGEAGAVARFFSDLYQCDPQSQLKGN